MLAIQSMSKTFFFRLTVITFLSCFASLLSYHEVTAEEKQTGPNLHPTTKVIASNKKHSVITARISAGYLSGEVNEIVYLPGGGDTKLSQLTWSMGNIYMISGGITIEPTDWLKVNTDFGVKANSGSNEMDDYDWLFQSSDWSDWSHHDDVELTKGSMLDINAEFTFTQQQTTTLSAIIGYKRDNWEWEARGGDFIYSFDNFRDTSGSFTPGLLTATYEQTIHVPYIGIGFQTNMAPAYLSGRLTGSFLATTTDNDHHHLRNLYYEREFEPGGMIGIDLASTYKFTDNLAIIGKYQFCNYFKTRGDTTITDLDTGIRYHFGDIAGTDNQVNIFSLSLAYTF